MTSEPAGGRGAEADGARSLCDEEDTSPPPPLPCLLELSHLHTHFSIPYLAGQGFGDFVKESEGKGPSLFPPSLLINMSLMFQGPGTCCAYWGRRVTRHVSSTF